MVAGGSLLTMKSSPAIRPVWIIFWLRDDSLADLDNLPDPDVLAEEIIENSGGWIGAVSGGFWRC
jgi:hypothetical protein